MGKIEGNKKIRKRKPLSQSFLDPAYLIYKKGVVAQLSD